MVPDIVQILWGEEAMFEKCRERRFDVKGVSTSEPDQAWVARDEVVGGFEVDGEDFGEDGGGWGEGVGFGGEW